MSRKAIFTSALIAALPFIAGGCGNVNQGRAPVVAQILALEGASGAKPTDYGGVLDSDVLTVVTKGTDKVATIFADPGRVTLQLQLKDPGVSGSTNAPSALNAVTITRYRVVYRRTDGHNVQGVDVPYAFDSGVTFTIPEASSVQAGFELVHASAKDDVPLRALQTNFGILNTIADVTFYGKDQAGNDVQITGSIGVNFANYGDPS